jgi:ferric-dicitrate binding protein FerR (iron transport regulator)
VASERLEYLYRQYTEAQATEAEVEEFFALVEKEGEGAVFQNLLSNTWDELQAANEKLEQSKARVIPLYKRWAFRVAAAAIFILLAGGTIWLVNTKKEVPVVASKPGPAVDIKPGSDKAILTLADGRQLILDTLANGAVADQAGTTVIKQGGQLLYNQVKGSEVVYNTIKVPRGGQYQLILADGSKVWLNAESSLRFPNVFSGNERKVELTGEGYFEVAHNAGKPFHVQVNDMDIKVLGTHFNINSYNNEPSFKVTLLEGRVMVKKGEKFIYLNPGQQAVTTSTGNDLSIQNNVDVDEVVAWKNGKFSFNSSDIETIMRQAARWYDVDVVYESKTDETFSGSPSRFENISQLLKILEATGKVQFQIKGKQVIVKAK